MDGVVWWTLDSHFYSDGSSSNKRLTASSALSTTLAYSFKYQKLLKESGWNTGQPLLLWRIISRQETTAQKVTGSSTLSPNLAGYFYSPRCVEEKNTFTLKDHQPTTDNSTKSDWLFRYCPFGQILVPGVLKSNNMIPPFFSLDTVIVKAMRYHMPVILKWQKLQCALSVPSTSRTKHSPNVSRLFDIDELNTIAVGGRISNICHRNGIIKVYCQNIDRYCCSQKSLFMKFFIA